MHSCGVFFLFVSRKRWVSSLKSQDIVTLVAQMEQWRLERLIAITLINHTRRDGKPPLTTRRDYIKLLCDSSEVFFEMVLWTQHNLISDDKLMILENVSIFAWH